ncbi:peroxisome biogenesis factor 2-like [Diabrotica undecimpunctata]|uniref:peroxisome biogenesis factor 2-like n=1 Tax=Diabrotica undecimpunctata TaxID=50387 RepID=UPI003B63EBBE
MSNNKNSLLRVTQMNAVYLDQEIYKSLYQIFTNATRNLPPGILASYESELNLILRFMLLNNSVVKNGCTFGQQLLSIKYEDIGTLQRVLYLLGHCLDYVKTKFEIWKPSHDLNNTFYKIYLVTKLLDFINLSVFLSNGVKPLLIERILGLNQVYATDNAQRHFESKYLARELLWNGFIEIIVYVIPLINYHKLRRMVRNFNPFHVKNDYSILPNKGMTMHTKCAHCGENPILPYHMGCNHIFCYVCLKGNQIADTMFECPRCEHKNTSIVCIRVTAA